MARKKKDETIGGRRGKPSINEVSNKRLRDLGLIGPPPKEEKLRVYGPKGKEQKLSAKEKRAIEAASARAYRMTREAIEERKEAKKWKDIEAKVKRWEREAAEEKKRRGR